MAPVLVSAGYSSSNHTLSKSLHFQITIPPIVDKIPCFSTFLGEDRSRVNRSWSRSRIFKIHIRFRLTGAGFSKFISGLRLTGAGFFKFKSGLRLTGAGFSNFVSGLRLTGTGTSAPAPAPAGYSGSGRPLTMSTIKLLNLY